jgi:CheY-like chemotaxis protein
MDTTSSFGNKRGHHLILVVGNKTQSMLSICLLLKRFAYSVSEAYTASEALALINREIPALIITDLVLPGMSGMDFFQMLKQSRRTASLPVVFTVPLSDAAAERQCYDNGAAGCIMKPIQSEELYRTVQSLVEPIPRASIRIDARSSVSLNRLGVPKILVRSICLNMACTCQLTSHTLGTDGSQSVSTSKTERFLPKVQLFTVTQVLDKGGTESRESGSSSSASHRETVNLSGVLSVMKSRGMSKKN